MDPRSTLSPVAEARLHGLPKILCIANWRVVRQGLGQRVGKALHPVCCQESVRELGNGIAIAGQVVWVVLPISVPLHAAHQGRASEKALT